MRTSDTIPTGLTYALISQGRDKPRVSSPASAPARLEAPDLLAILDALPVLVSYIDRDLVYRLNNRAYEDWFGHARGEVTGRPVREVLGDAAFAALAPHIDRVLRGERVEFDLHAPYKDGGSRDIRATYLPHRDGAGEVVGFVVHVRDRTREVETERALALAHADLELRINERTRELATQKEFLETILGATSDLGQGVILLDGPKITYANDAFLAMVARTREEILALPSSLVLSPPEQAEKIKDRFEKRARGEPIPPAFDAQILRPDGSVLDVEVTSKEMGGGRALSLLRDISARKALEREQRQQRVARGIVRQLFAHLTSNGRSSYAVRREIGRSLAAASTEATIGDQLAAFGSMGLGELKLEDAKGPRHTFLGSGLIDVGSRSTVPTCGLALGYLEGILRAQTGRDALGTEIHCQAQGAPQCKFVVNVR